MSGACGVNMSGKRPERLEKDVPLEELFLPEITGDHGFMAGAEESFEELLPQYLEPGERAPEDQPLTTSTTPDRGGRGEGGWRVRDSLDLHGVGVKEAGRRLEFFLERSRHRKMGCVRIITGRGLHSPGGPVLKDMVETRLVELKRDGMIRGFRWEKKKKKKSGALLVRL